MKTRKKKRNTLRLLPFSTSGGKSPKPRAGQRLRAPPRRRLLHIVRGDFQNHRLLISRRLLFAKGHAPFACSVVNALATALCRYQPFARKKKARAGVGAAVEKIEEKRHPEDFFGHRKRGCEAASSPSAPATEKPCNRKGCAVFLIFLLQETNRLV